MSSEKVVKTVPFTTGFAHGTMNIISRDRARVQELQAGLYPHGPRVFQERRARRADLNLGNALSAASDLPDQEDSAADHGKRIFANNNGTSDIPILVHNAEVCCKVSYILYLLVSVSQLNNILFSLILVRSNMLPFLPTPLILLDDLGSSITWIGADKKYNPTPTSKPTGKKVVRTH